MRHLFLSLVALGFAAAITVAAEPPAAAPQQPSTSQKTPKDTCVEPCKACAAICAECMKHCDKLGHKDIARMCEACHHACLMCATAVANKTPNAWQACELCEKFCNDCAAMCDKHPGDEIMKKCADECRKCAKACADARK
jgi:hypothetical protein